MWVPNWAILNYLLLGGYVYECSLAQTSYMWERKSRIAYGFPINFRYRAAVN